MSKKYILDNEIEKRLSESNEISSERLQFLLFLDGIDETKDEVLESLCQLINRGQAKLTKNRKYGNGRYKDI